VKRSGREDDGRRPKTREKKGAVVSTEQGARKWKGTIRNMILCERNGGGDCGGGGVGGVQKKEGCLSREVGRLGTVHAHVVW